MCTHTYVLKKLRLYRRMEKLIDTTLQDLSNLDHGLLKFEVRLVELEKKIKEKEWAINYFQESINNINILYPEFTIDETNIKKQTLEKQISNHTYHLYQLKEELETKERIKMEKLDNCGRAMMQLICRKMPHLLIIPSTSCICCAEEETTFFANKCGHVLCKNCWDNTKKDSKPCPLCKQKVFYKSLRRINSSWYDIDKTLINPGPYRDQIDSEYEENPYQSRTL